MGNARSNELTMKLFMSLDSADRIIKCKPKRSQPGALHHTHELVSRFPEFNKVTKLDAVSEKRQARDDIVPVMRWHNDQALVPIGHTERCETYRHCRRGVGRRRHARSLVIHHV